VSNRKQLFLKLLKEKSCIEEHTSFDSNSESDALCTAIKDLLIKLETAKVSQIVEGGTQKSPSPRKYIEQLKRKKENNVSNYHNYIKNIKNINKDTDSITPSTSQKKAKSSKYSFDPQLSKNKTGDKEDSLSVNLLKFNGSTNDLSNASRTNKIQVLVDATEDRKLTENSNSLENMTIHVSSIQSKLLLMEESIRLFQSQTMDIKEIFDNL